MEDNQRFIPAGNYIARSTGPADVQFGYANSGSEQISVVLALQNEGYEGKVVTWFGSFASEESQKITMRQMRDMGWSTDNVTNPEGIDANEVEITIDYEEFQGKERMKIKRIAPVGGFKVEMKKPMDDAQKKAFAARMRGAALQTKKAGPAAARPAFRPSGGGAPAQRPAWDGQGPDPDDTSDPYDPNRPF